MLYSLGQVCLRKLTLLTSDTSSFQRAVEIHAKKKKGFSKIALSLGKNQWGLQEEPQEGLVTIQDDFISSSWEGFYIQVHRKYLVPMMEPKWN